VALVSQEDQQGSTRSLVGRFVPGIEAISQYKISWLGSDIAAGLSVAAVALPVGIAYSELAGVPAVIGIYSAIFPLFAYALFGSSRQLMTGPDAATCIMMAAALGPLAGGDPERYGSLVIVMTLLVGLIYIVAGIARLGFIASFLSLPILVGFLNGIALLIIAGQLPKLLGYTVESGKFIPQLIELVEKLNTTHLPTFTLGFALLIGMFALRRFVPRLPGALIIVIVGIILVAAFNLQPKGVVTIGAVPAGLPAFFHIPIPPLQEFPVILRDAAGLALVSFTSGILTAKSFAQRNRYDVDANRELIGFGAANIASGLAQGFVVTGADSRTAVNNAMGGKSQMVGIVAGSTMLLILFFLTEPLVYLPQAALAAVIIVSAVGLFDISTLRELYTMNRVELAFSVGTTLGVLTLGVLPGVLLAVVLSLFMLLALSSRPPDAVLGRVPGIKGFHDCKEYPEAETVPGLLLYRFEANVVFYNADYFKEKVLAAINAAKTPVEWVVVDASSVNVVDSTAIQRIDQLHEELAARGIELAVAGKKRSTERFFEGSWVNARRELTEAHNYPTVKSAVKAFEKRSTGT